MILWFYAASPRPLRAVSAMFLIGYGSLRFIAEFFRTPDPGIFGTLTLGLSTAQWLCVPMVVVGGLMLVLAARARGAERAGAVTPRRRPARPLSRAGSSASTPIASAPRARAAAAAIESAAGHQGDDAAARRHALEQPDQARRLLGHDLAQSRMTMSGADWK